MAHMTSPLGARFMSGVGTLMLWMRLGLFRSSRCMYIFTYIYIYIDYAWRESYVYIYIYIYICIDI